MALIYISLMIRGAEYILVHLLTISVDSLDICLFKSFAHFKKIKFFGPL